MKEYEESFNDRKLHQWGIVADLFDDLLDDRKIGEVEIPRRT